MKKQMVFLGQLRPRPVVVLATVLFLVVAACSGAALARSGSIAGKGVTGDSRIGSRALAYPLEHQPHRSENPRGRWMSQPRVPEPPQREPIAARAPIPDPAPQLIRRGFIPLGGNGMGGPKVKTGTTQFGTTAYLQPRPIVLAPPRDPNRRHHESVPNPSVAHPGSLTPQVTSGARVR
jgi:hypothetical protein